MTSSGQSSKYHSIGHFLSTHQNADIILEKVARATNQELLVSLNAQSHDRICNVGEALGKLNLPSVCFRLLICSIDVANAMGKKRRIVQTGK